MIRSLLALRSCCLPMVILAAAMPAFANPPEPPPAEHEKLCDTLLVLDKQFWEAASKHDVETLGRLFADDFLGFGWDGTRWTKSALLDQHRQRRLGDFKLIGEREVIRLNETTAVVTYEATFNMYSREGALCDTAHQRMTACWVQRDGGWFVRFSQSFNLPPVAKSADVAERVEQPRPSLQSAQRERPRIDEF